MLTKMILRSAAAALVSALAASSAARAEDPTPLQVLTTTTDLRELARAVGGADVAVTCLTKGPEDPHHIEARPSFVTAASRADVLVVTGLELEIGYEPLLLGDSRNARIQKGKPGYVDASAGISVLDVPTGTVDRSQGDVHPSGNPHYLADPVRGKQAARTIAEAFAAIDPPRAEAYRRRLAEFTRAVDVAMFGEEILAELPAERLERRLAEGKLLEYLRSRGAEAKLAGLAAEMAPFAGRKVVSYHANAIYFLDRFHVIDLAHLEPKPGIAPSPRHLASVMERMRAEGARVVLHSSYQPARTAESVAAEVGGASVAFAHMPDSQPDTATYVHCLVRNVRSLAAAFRAADGATEGR